jgi:hypothetical protein
MLEQDHQDFDESISYETGLALAKAVNKVYTPPQYKYSGFNKLPGSLIKRSLINGKPY